MASASLANVLSHWATLIENLQASPQDFYASVQKAIEKRDLPEARISRWQWSESGAFSARRLYLRVQRREHTLEICGAPFGTGFFVSEWLSEPGPSILAGVIYMLIGFAALGWSFSSSAWEFFRELQLQYVGVLWFRGLVTLGIVLAGVFGVIRPLFFPPRPTYYRIDTAQMFLTAVHQAVLEVVDETISTKGLRALTEMERKPIMREFYNFRR